MLLTRQGISLEARSLIYQETLLLGKPDEHLRSSCMSPCRRDYIFADRRAGVWRVVSEDSDHFGTWLAVVHRLCQFSDLDQPTRSQVQIPLDQLHAPHKLLEVMLL